MFPLDNFADPEICQNMHPSLTYYYSGTSSSPLCNHQTQLASSKNCNFLEAINFALNRLQSQDLEKKSTYTGAALMVVSAGNSFYHTSKRLIKITKARVLTYGAGLEVICLRRKPIHPTPMFAYDMAPTVKQSIEEEFGEIIGKSDENDKKYTYPYWFRVH